MAESVLEHLRRAGRDLFEAGLVSTRGGNLSVRVGDSVVVTRTGAALPHLGPGDVVEVPLDAPGERDAEASSDVEIHRAIYRRTPHRAVVHAHPTGVVVLAFGSDAIVPLDHEGKLFVPRVPVVDQLEPKRALGERVADALEGQTLVVAVRSHGTYAAGDSIEAATNWTTVVELSAKVLLGLRER